VLAYERDIFCLDVITGESLMNAESSEQREWLTRVHETLKWTVAGPNIKNPFDAESSDEALISYVNDRSALMSVTVVKAIMDETEIIKITDLAALDFETVHPNLVNIERADLQGYLDEFGVWDIINNEIESFQQACREEVDNRGV